MEGDIYAVLPHLHNCMLVCKCMDVLLKFMQNFEQFKVLGLTKSDLSDKVYHIHISNVL